MSNKTQRKFKRIMNSISKQEKKKKARFFSFLENDVILGYYVKRKTDKWERRWVKFLQYVMIVVLIGLGLAMTLSVSLAENVTDSIHSMMIIGTMILFVIVCFGLIHPYVVLSDVYMKSRMRVLKYYGTSTLISLAVTIVYSILME
ncbi:hypothetical protein SY83_20360 [Paenibacillus swuensis]|uniref:Uncharacterized protein n=1 Tax=Paenibacillus swuensis TaxID=1178515 RepID=A0A172TMI3_9BACL|nr:hypothetical protein [Paenibacillus swuensis]ANE48251.1 hypothetical protein SY83_20360 [Paenibacillus swuensis]